MEAESSLRGFTLTEEGSNRTHIWKYYQDNIGNYYKIDLVYNAGQLTSWDTEGAETIPVDINGATGFLAQENEETLLALIDTEKSITLTIRSYGIDMNSLIQLAENVNFSLEN